MKWKWIDADCTSVTTAEGTLTLKGLFIPLFIEQLLMNMTGTVNTLMLGHYADDAVAAVGAANQVIGFLYTFYAVFSGGASVVISHRLGAGDEKRASDAAFTSIVCGGAISLILGTILAFFAGAVMRPMQLETSVYEMAVVYFRICIGFSVLQGIISAISAVLRSYGKPKLAVTVSYEYRECSVKLRCDLPAGENCAGGRGRDCNGKRGKSWDGAFTWRLVSVPLRTAS